MNGQEFKQNSPAWYEWRKGKIGGSSVKGLVSFKDMLKADLIEKCYELEIELPMTKTGTVKATVEELHHLILQVDENFNFRKLVEKVNQDMEYKMLAYELSDGSATEEEDPRERGHRLEPEARNATAEIIGKEIEEVGGVESTDNPRISLSPDGIINNGEEAVEVKCLAGWKHVKYWLEDAIPDLYIEQVLQYFVVLDQCQKVYFVLYHPEIKVHKTHIIEVHRADWLDEIEIMKMAQNNFFTRSAEILEKIYSGEYVSKFERDLVSLKKPIQDLKKEIENN